jgi:deazaflavin-dependent oxidoreductase (nitroreductase family)
MDKTELDDWNARVIAEFRNSAGAPGGPGAGRPLLLLTTVGARTGQQRTTPLVYLADGERLLVFASKGGSPTNPDWYHNLVAHPDIAVEKGRETIAVRATEVHGAERDATFERQAARFPIFAEYARTLDRTIPVLRLDRRNA